MRLGGKSPYLVLNDWSDWASVLISAETRASLALRTAPTIVGSSSPTRMPMITMTTSSSTSVKPALGRRGGWAWDIGRVSCSFGRSSGSVDQVACSGFPGADDERAVREGGLVRGRRWV